LESFKTVCSCRSEPKAPENTISLTFLLKLQNLPLHHNSVLKEEGCANCLMFTYNMFYTFHFCSICMLFMCFQITQTLSHNVFVIYIIFKLKFEVIYNRRNVISCWVGTTKSSRALRWRLLKTSIPDTQERLWL